MTQPGMERVSTPEQSVAIQVDDLIVSYGRKRAVDSLSMTVTRGSVYGFLGPNGAGKTSTIKTLMGFRKPNGGIGRCSVTTSSTRVWADAGDRVRD